MMKFLRRAVTSFLLVFISTGLASVAQAQCLEPPTEDGLIVPTNASSTKLILVTEQQLRRMAIKSVIPDFPRKEAEDGEKATAEASLEVNEKGDVIRVKVSGLLDKKLKEAVADAVKQWKFTPFIVYTDVINGCFLGKRVRARGSLNFDYGKDKD